MWAPGIDIDSFTRGATIAATRAYSMQVGEGAGVCVWCACVRLADMWRADEARHRARRASFRGAHARGMC
jgi:hypothetical protein